MHRTRPLVAALVTAATLTPLATGLGPGAAAAGSGSICVALVVDFRHLGGSVDTSCATVRDGSTGVDVLQAAGHTVGFRSDGLICTIDGLPRDGCAATDDSHFWGYFHRAPGGSSGAWHFSTEGASTYRPRNRSSEGWTWENGSTGPPAAVAYSSVCRATPTPSPSTAPRPATQPAAAASSAPTSGAPTRTGVAPRPARRPSAVRPVAAPSPDPGPTRPGPVGTAAASPTSTGGGVPLGLAGGLAAVVAIGAAAGWRARRARG